MSICHHPQSGETFRRIQECILPFSCSSQLPKGAGTKQIRLYPPQSTKSNPVISPVHYSIYSLKRSRVAARIQQKNFYTTSHVQDREPEHVLALWLLSA